MYNQMKYFIYIERTHRHCMMGNMQTNGIIFVIFGHDKKHGTYNFLK